MSWAQFIVKYCFKSLNCNEKKYIKYMYKMMLTDLEEYPNKINWSYLVKDLLSRGQFHKTAKQEFLKWKVYHHGNVSV